MTGVYRAHDAEVPPVQGCELWFSQSLDACQHGRVDQPEREVGVLIDKGAGARELGRVGEVYFQTSGFNISHQRGEPTLPRSKLVLDFHKRADRDDPHFAGGVDEFAAAIVIGIAAIDERHERASIEDQRQASGRYSRQRALPPLSIVPVDDSGSRRCTPSSCSSASRTSCGKLTPR